MRIAHVHMISSRKRAADPEHCNECGKTLSLHESENVLRSENQTTSIDPAMKRSCLPTLCFSCRKDAAKNAPNVERQSQSVPNDGSPSELTEIKSLSSHAVRMETKGMNEVECQPQVMSHDRTMSEYFWHFASQFRASLLAIAPSDFMHSKKRKVEGDDAEFSVPRVPFSAATNVLDPSTEENTDRPYCCRDTTVIDERQVPGSQSAKIAATNDADDSEIRTGNIAFERGKRRVIGLSNLGNTCYFNSVLQCLGALEPMREHFLSTTVTRKGTPLTSALQEFYVASSVTQKILPDENLSAENINRNASRGTKGKKFRNAQKKNLKVCRNYIPNSFLEAVREKYPQFNGGNQEDSLDLLKCLLDGLHAEEISSQHLGQGEVGVDQIVGFEEANSSECQICSHKTTSIQRSRSISLPVWMLTSLQRESSEGNVGRRLRGGGGGDAIDIEKASHYQYPADRAFQFLLDEIKQRESDIRETVPLLAGVEDYEVGETLGVGTEDAEKMEKSTVGEVDELDTVLWSPTEKQVAVTQTDLNSTSSEGCGMTIARQLSDDAADVRLSSHVARENDEEGRTGMPNIDADKSAILAENHSVSVEGAVYNGHEMRMGSQTLESDQAAQKNDEREEGRGRNRGWEVPFNGVVAVKENGTKESSTPQVSGRAQIFGASVDRRNPRLPEPEVYGIGVSSPAMPPVDGASNGKKNYPRGTFEKAVPVSASIPPTPVVPRDKVTLHDCLREYTKGEEFSGENAWYCTGCTEQEKNTAKEKLRTEKTRGTIQTEDVSWGGQTLGAVDGGSFQEEVDVDDWWPPVRSEMTMKRTLLNTLPHVLIFHLNRFENDEFRPGHFKKTSGHVAFEEVLDMQPYLDNRVVDGSYRLMGVVSHAGDIGWGHYVAFVRGGEAPVANTPLHREFETRHTPWFHCSDSYVKETRLEEILQCEAYLLFYQRF